MGEKGAPEEELRGGAGPGPGGETKVIRRVGTVNCHVRVEGNSRTLGYMMREKVKLDVCAVTETWLREEEHTTGMVLGQSGYEWESRLRRAWDGKR